MKLYEIAENYKNLIDLVEAGEVDTEILKSAMEQVEGTLIEKLENTTKVIKGLEGDIKALKDEEKRLSDRRKALENNVTSLKDYMTSCMRLADIKKVKGTLFSFNIQKNRASLKIDTDRIAEGYKVQVITYEVDKDKIKADIEAGEVVEGAEIVQSESLRIR